MGLPVRLRVWPARWTDLPDGRPVTISRPDRVDWFVDGAEIDPRLLTALGRVGTQTSSMMTQLERPADEPWGDLKVVREDISVLEMAKQWTITSAGIYLPVPRTMMTARLLSDIVASCVEQMRWLTFHA